MHPTLALAMPVALFIAALLTAPAGTEQASSSTPAPSTSAPSAASNVSPGETAQSAAGGALQVYFIDVEGGQSTLFVTPDRHSLLIDTGWPGNHGRDADRIVAAAHQAGLTRIDTVLITHFHTDHVGGVPLLLARIPVGTLIDHGVNREDSDGPTREVYAAYQRVLASSNAPQRMVAKLGQTWTIGSAGSGSLRVDVVSVDGQLIAHPLPGASGAGALNPACAQSEVRAADQTENSRSLGVVLRYGRTTLVDLGDLTWDKERPLMCPSNLLGKADVYIVSHHGWDQSGSPAFVNGLAPRLAMMDNGGTKGGSPGPWQTIQFSPRLEDLWQLHYAEAPSANNVPEERIANLKGGAEGNYLRLSVAVDGTLSVFNARTGASKSYTTAGQ